jgi:hypothetical protein
MWPRPNLDLCSVFIVFFEVTPFLGAKCLQMAKHKVPYLRWAVTGLAAFFVVRWLLHYYPIIVWAFSAIVSLSPQVLAPPAVLCSTVLNPVEKDTTDANLHHARQGWLLSVITIVGSFFIMPRLFGLALSFIIFRTMASLPFEVNRPSWTCRHSILVSPPLVSLSCFSLRSSAAAFPPCFSAVTRFVLAQVSVGSASIGRLLDVTIRLRNKRSTEGTVRAYDTSPPTLEQRAVERGREQKGREGEGIYI